MPPFGLESWDDDEHLHHFGIEFRSLSSAIAILSQGKALSNEWHETIEGHMEHHAWPRPYRAQIKAVLASGSRPKDVPRTPELPDTQATLLVARLLLLGGCVLDPATTRESVSQLAPWLGVDREVFKQLHRNILAQKLSPKSPPELLNDFLHPSQALITLAHDSIKTQNRPHIGAIDPAQIQHPKDVEAIETIKRLGGLDDLVRKLSEHVSERVFRLSLTANAIAINERQLPDLYRIYRGCVERSGISKVPDLYLQQGGLNAMTGGIEEPFIILNSGMVGVCNQHELEFVIGHELGHLRFEHITYNAIVQILQLPTRMIPVIGSLLTSSITLALRSWQRNAELSCDRFGLMIAQDLPASLRLLMRLSGAPSMYLNQCDPDVFLSQYQTLKEAWEDQTSRFFLEALSANRTHPWTVIRAGELNAWHNSDDYQRLGETFNSNKAPKETIFEALTEDLLPKGSTRCGKCASICPPNHRFCHACGHSLISQ